MNASTGVGMLEQVFRCEDRCWNVRTGVGMLGPVLEC